MEQNPKADRKTIEKNRRNHMKSLFSKLSSLVPHNSREVLSLPDQLEEATDYIKKLQTKLERMKERRDNIAGGVKRSSEALMARTMKVPQVEIHEMGSVLEVVLITGLDCQFLFSEAIRVLQEEKAEVVNASFSVLGTNVFQTIHSKISDSDPHYGAARISERLKKMVYE